MQESEQFGYIAARAVRSEVCAHDVEEKNAKSKKTSDAQPAAMLKNVSGF